MTDAIFALSNPFRPEGFDFSREASLRGAQCTTCGETFFPPRKTCLRCSGCHMESVVLSRVGKIHGYTVVHRAPQGFEPPYACGWVELPEGTRIWSIFKGPVEKLRIGARVELVFDQLADRTAYFFLLAD